MLAIESGATLAKPEAGDRRVAGASCGHRPVDLVFLARQTFGDRHLEAEVLRLFLGQAPRLMAEIKTATGEDRRRLAHRLTGAARGIGAWVVAETAARVEASGADSDVDLLEDAVTIATAFIGRLVTPDLPSEAPPMRARA